MAHLIRNNPDIKGIKMEKGVEHVLTQFTDDTGLFLMYSEQCINAVIDTLLHVESNTGLKVSYEKTCIYRVGSLKGTNAKCYTKMPLAWSDDDIKMLGVTIKNDVNQDNIDFESTLEKVESVTKSWCNRQLTLMGKTHVINSLMSSQFVYLMAVLPLINSAQIVKFEKLITNYLWNGHKTKIPLNV